MSDKKGWIPPNIGGYKPVASLIKCACGKSGSDHVCIGGVDTEIKPLEIQLAEAKAEIETLKMYKTLFESAESRLKHLEKVLGIIAGSGDPLLMQRAATEALVD